MNLEYTGKLIEKGKTNQISDKFKKREFVLEHTEIVGQKEFTDTVKFQLTQDRCDLIESVTIGSEVKVSFNIRGNKWERDGKVNYFNNLDVWKIEVTTENNSVVENEVPPIDDSDDLPF